jgi:hypothetical protein
LTDKQKANNAFMDCFSKQSSLLVDVAAERKVDIVDQDGMKQVGIDIGTNLLNQNCSSFLKLAMLMNGKLSENNEVEASEGIFKRVENKGFNYLVFVSSNKEQSYLWLRQFPESEVFQDGGISNIGKRFKVKWQELEVYVPSAKGYYKVKEIIEVNKL